MLLRAQPLTKKSFAPYGDVIETDGAEHYPINAGAIERYHDLARGRGRCGRRQDADQYREMQPAEYAGLIEYRSLSAIVWAARPSSRSPVRE